MRLHLLILLLGLALQFNLGCSSDADDDSTATDDDTSGDDDDAVGGCVTTEDCSGDLLCDRILGECVECRVTADCAGTFRCEDSECVQTPSCTSDLDCTDEGLFCDQDDGRCVECNRAAECNEQPCLGSTCVATHTCQTSLDCTDLNMICAEALPPLWPESFLGMGCQECGTDGDCSQGDGCEEGHCFDVCGDRICGHHEGVACGECPVSDTCAESQRACLIRVVSPSTPFHVLKDDPDSIFMASHERDAIYKVDKATWDQEAAVQLGTDLAGMDVNSTDLVWIVADGRVSSMPLGGGSTEVIAQLQPTANPVRLVADDDFAYVAEDGYYTGAGRLVRVDLDSGDETVLGSTFDPGALALAHEMVFWSGHDEVGMTPIDGGTTTVLASIDAYDNEIAVSDDHLYYFTEGDQGDAVWRIPVEGGQAEEFFLHGLPLVVQRDELIVCGAGGGSVWTISMETLEAKELLSYTEVQEVTSGLVATDGTLYIGADEILWWLYR